MIVLRGTFDAAHECRYAHVPFEVPAGVRGMHVVYDYNDRIPSDPLLRGGNTLDIGLFDPRGIASSGPAFAAGVAAQARLYDCREVGDATLPCRTDPSGHVARPAWAGQGRPARLRLRSCDHFCHETAEPPGLRPIQVSATPARLEVDAEPGWLRGDLHCHTLHSDGDSWPTDMLAEAVSRGLDFLGVTDHNQTSHQADDARATGEHLPIVLPGIEVTTYGGHWNASGTNTWWEFREPTEAATSRAMQAAAASGALVSVNHPKPFGPAWEYPNAVGYHAIEVWNGDWQRMNHVSLRWWDEQLRAGRGIVALGGSDTHQLKQIDADMRHGRHLGLPTTWAHVGDDRSTQGVLNALRAGDAFISRDLDGPQLYFSRSDGGFRVHAVDARRAALMLVSARGVETTMTVPAADWCEVFRLDDPPMYVRAQMMDEHGQMLALSNVVFT